jgi:hypothetical protein
MTIASNLHLLLSPYIDGEKPGALTAYDVWTHMPGVMPEPEDPTPEPSLSMEQMAERERRRTRPRVQRR